MAENVVRVSGLTKTFGKNTVLSNVNISLERGKIYGFIGQNGAGKTTLINHINGLLFPDEGEIELFGASDSKGLVNARKRIGTVCEHAGLHDNYNAVDNIKLNMKLRGIKNDKLIEQTIANVGLQGVGKKRFRNYSMGMKQRLAIGCAMLSGPDLLLLDEPINGLDPVGIVEIRNLLKQINQRFGVTILISSHILTELHELATDYIMIDRGQIIDCLSAAQLDAKCHRRLRLRTNDVKKVLDILAMRYNIVNVYVNGDEIIVDQPVNSDELAWVLYNERVFVSEYHLEEESLENYFIHRIGVLIMRELLSAEFYKLYKSLGFRVCLIVFFVQDIIYLISVGLVGDILGIELTGDFQFQYLLGSFSGSSVSGMLFGFIAASLITSDYKSRDIQCAIAQGHSRAHIMFSRS